jgi:hypothetical protein
MQGAQYNRRVNFESQGRTSNGDTGPVEPIAYSMQSGISALGQKQTFAVQHGMSALPPIVDISRDQAARFVTEREGAMADALSILCRCRLAT